MPVLDYDANYSTYAYGNLAKKQKKKVVFDQDNPNYQDFYEEKYQDDYRRIEERLSKKRQSFDYDTMAMFGKKKEYAEKPETIEPEEIEDIEEAKKKRREAREKVVRRIINGFIFGFTATIALLIVYRYSLINEKFNEVEKAKKKLENSITINEQIQADIDSETDISYIENYAKYQLGMQKPQESQIMYVNHEKKDKIFTPIRIDEEVHERTWVDDLIENLASFFE